MTAHDSLLQEYFSNTLCFWILIWHVVRNWTLHYWFLQFEETRTESNGMVIFDVNINASGCFFQFNISSHLQNFSSGAVVCSFLDGGLLRSIIIDYPLNYTYIFLCISSDDRKTDQFNLYVCNQGTYDYQIWHNVSHMCSNCMVIQLHVGL